jgi:hypothetical protein
MATWTYTAGAWDLNGLTDIRPIASKLRLVGGAGTTSTISGHTQTIAVDTSVLPIFTLIPGTGGDLASATSITPTNRTHHVTGTTPIGTIVSTGMIDGEKLTLVPGGAFTFTTGGNIGSVQTAVVGQAIDLTWEATAGKWYPTTASGTASGGASTIASGTADLGTSEISSGTCATVVTVSAPGVATTDVVTASFNGDTTAATGYTASASGGLSIRQYPTSDNVNFSVCNSTADPITPDAITLNWRVAR